MESSSDSKLLPYYHSEKRVINDGSSHLAWKMARMKDAIQKCGASSKGLRKRRVRSSLAAFAHAANRYRPKTIRLLFIAEAPPAYRVNRLFYFEDLKDGDTLFLEMMKVLYCGGKAASREDRLSRNCSVKEIRQLKADFLRRFMRDGYFLIDASERPMPDGATASFKLAALRKSLPRLMTRVKEILGEQKDTPIVLIGAVTHAACAQPLKEQGYNIINTAIINHPARGGQIHFRRKLTDALQNIQIITEPKQTLESFLRSES